MPNFEDLGMNTRFQPNKSIPNTRPHVIDENEFRNTHRIPTGFVDYQNLTKDARFATAVVSLSGERGTFKDIQAAIVYVNSLGGGVVYLRAGTYFISSQITLYSNIFLVGEGISSTVLDFQETSMDQGVFINGTLRSLSGIITLTNNDATIVGTSSLFSSDGVIAGDILHTDYGQFIVDSVTSDTSLEITKTYFGNTQADIGYYINEPTNNVLIDSLSIKGVGTPSSGNGIGVKADNCTNIRFQNLHITDCEEYGLWVEETTGLELVNCLIDNTNENDGAFIGANSASVSPSGIITGNRFINNKLYGLNLTKGHSISLIDNIFSHNGSGGVNSNNSIGMRATSNFFVSNKNVGINLTSSSYTNISGNLFFNNGTAVSFSSVGQNNVIIGNNLYTSTDSVVTASNTNNNLIVGNNFGTAGATVTASGTNDRVIGNMGVHDNDYDVGLGTVAAGVSAGTITFSYLGGTPETVVLTPQNSLGSASEYYVDTIGTTTFIIHTDTAPGTAVVFNWRADNEKP